VRYQIKNESRNGQSINTASPLPGL
jgi:hypothetical protein